MGAYKDKNGTWYAQFRFTNWKGEPDRKTKRGFATKREALDWERDFLTQSSGNLESAKNNKHLHVCWSETRINISIIAKTLGLCYNKNAPRGARPTRYLQPQSHRSMYPGPCITLLKWIIRFSQAVFQAKWYQTMIPIWYPELWELWEHREKHEFTSQNSLQTTITEGEKEPREGTPKRVGISESERRFPMCGIVGYKYSAMNFCLKTSGIPTNGFW